MIRTLVLFLCVHVVSHAAVTYNLRDARFFGETTSRETTQSGAFNAATNQQLLVNYSTGGGSPTDFNGLATVQGTPFRLGAKNYIEADAPTPLTYNDDFLTPSPIVSIVGSTITETNVVVTGGSGTGYLLPTFRIRGSFEDNHPTAIGYAVTCAGVNTCILTSVANSSGPSVIDTLFTPPIGVSTDFTFGVPFTFFFFMQGSIQSNTPGSLGPGNLLVDLTSGLELLNVAVVDANGTPIPGAVVNSEFLRQTAVPEPGCVSLVGCGAVAFVLLRSRRVAKR